MVEYMRQEPPDDPAIAICEHCEDSGEWREWLHECDDAAMMQCPLAAGLIAVEDCYAVENARYARNKGRR